MIVQFILSGIMQALKFILGALPNIPPMPSFITDSAEYIADLIVGVVGILVYVFTQQLFTFIVLTVIVLMNFETIYRTVMWVIRKLPISSS